VSLGNGHPNQAWISPRTHSSGIVAIAIRLAESGHVEAIAARP
jgi:hypothetical protein